MRIHIDLGWLFRLFRRKNRKPIKEIDNVDWPLVTEESITNCCEQVGAFGIFGIDSVDVKNKIVGDIVKEFNSLEKTLSNLVEAVEDGFDDNNYDLSPKEAKKIVDCFIASYIHNN